MNWKDLSFWSSPTWEDLRRELFQEMNSGVRIAPDFTRWKWERAMDLCPYEQTKVIIVGQDPYYTPGVADGLAFSSGNPYYRPPSLANIYLELKNDLGLERNKNSLEGWARQGVLLFNTSLTVVEGRPNSHQGMWDYLLVDTFQTLRKKEHLVWVLWGNYARSYSGWGRHNENHLVLESAHPSPLSASRGFFGSKPFSKTNEYLAQANLELIDWSK